MKHHCSCLSGLFLVLVFQMLAICIRFIFDFLGLQYAAIAADICQILGLIIGTYGSWKLKNPLLAVYSMWTGLWIIWNFYIICLHFQIGILRLSEHAWTVNLLNEESATSWFKSHPFACATAINYTLATDVLKVDEASFCWSDYRLIEVYISTFQILLAVFGLSFALGTIREVVEHEEEDANCSVLSIKYVNSLERDRKRKIVYEPPPHEQPLVEAAATHGYQT